VKKEKWYWQEDILEKEKDAKIIYSNLRRVKRKRTRREKEITKQMTRSE
jgi:hypothetical protein